mmetsp:Transcript_59704/g.99046  ORF Transcript_59704/g.99046 Transcript_59704/m.99046 type:complete len:310 (+) Transcript_59704:1091-2020(+)
MVYGRKNAALIMIAISPVRRTMVSPLKGRSVLLSAQHICSLIVAPRRCLALRNVTYSAMTMQPASPLVVSAVKPWLVIQCAMALGRWNAPNITPASTVAPRMLVHRLSLRPALKSATPILPQTATVNRHSSPARRHSHHHSHLTVDPNRSLAHHRPKSIRHHHITRKGPTMQPTPTKWANPCQPSQSVSTPTPVAVAAAATPVLVAVQCQCPIILRTLLLMVVVEWASPFLIMTALLLIVVMEWACNIILTALLLMVVMEWACIFLAALAEAAAATHHHQNIALTTALINAKIMQLVCQLWELDVTHLP